MSKHPPSEPPSSDARIALEKAWKSRAISQLAARRQIAVPPAMIDDYTNGLHDFDATIVGRACEQISLTPVPEFQPRFPDLGTIRQQCFALYARQREAEETQRRSRALTGPGIWQRPDILDKLKADVRALCEKRRMR